jgi:hypothetical protein
MKRNKIHVTATVSPLTERQLDALVGSHHLFSSRSDAVEKAIGMMFSALNTGHLCDCAEQYGITLHGNMAGQTVPVTG